jgi:hypothetical protein
MISAYKMNKQSKFGHAYYTQNRGSSGQHNAWDTSDRFLFLYLENDSI